MAARSTSTTKSCVSLWPARRQLNRRPLRRHGQGRLLGLQSLEPRIAFATTASIVADLNTIPESGYPSLYARSATANGLVFVAADPDHGGEPWVTDGTAAGTKLLKDVNSGVYSSEIMSFSPLYNGSSYFLPFLRSGGTQLWKTDGTAAGTVAVATLQDQFTWGQTGNFVPFGGDLYFCAEGQVWKTDGTAAGTAVVPAFGSSGTGCILVVLGSTLVAVQSDGTGLNIFGKTAINAPSLIASIPGMGLNASDGGDHAVLGTRIIFQGYDQNASVEVLCTSDGTAAGSGPVFPGGGGPTNPRGFTAFGGAVYFAAGDAVNGIELWKTDGTAAGTTLVKDINPGAADSHPYDLTVAGGKLFFSASTANAGGELWVSDGTAAGTKLVADLASGSLGGTPVSSYPNALTPFNGQLYFSANGNKLWKSDGTAAGTTLVKDIDPNEPTGGSAGFGAMAEFNGRLFFPADDGGAGRELWSSDGTAAGTSLTKDIAAGNGDGVEAGSASYLAGAALNGMFLFAGNNGSTGSEVYKRDASGAVSLVKDIVPTVPPEFGGSNPGGRPDEFMAFGGAVYFSTSVADPVDHVPYYSSRQVWKSDGTTAGTARFGTAKSDFSATFGFTQYGDYLFFRADTPAGRGLFRTDGTVAGTVLVAGDCDAENLTVCNGKLYCVVTDLVMVDMGPPLGLYPVPQRRIYVLDTPGSTPVRAAFDDGSLFRDPDSLAAVGSKLFIAARSGDQSKLFVTNGTLAGTTAVGSGGGAFPSPNGLLTPAAGTLLFTASTPATGSELWRTQTVGGVETAVLVKDIATGAGDAPIFTMVANGTKANFLVYDLVTTQPVLWETDGTDAGTKPVAFAGGSGPTVRQLSKPVGDTMFVAASDATHGTELWTLQEANNAPTAIAISSASVAENMPAGTVVGTFSTTDPDVGNTFTYTIVPDATLAGTNLFEIVGNQLRTKGPFDFETKASYTIRVRSTDQGGLFVGRPLTIGVTNVNETPTAIAISSASVAENMPAGTVVGTFSTTDPDAGNTFKYTILPDASLDGTGQFEIVGNQLRTKGPFDFETKSTFTIRVRSTDQGGLFIGRLFTITVTNVNEAPTAITISSASVAENMPAGTVVGTFSTTDPDVGNTFTYTIVPDATLVGTNLFEIVGNQLRTKAPFNFETKASYTIRVRSTDQGGLFVGRPLTIGITNVNETPTAIALSAASVPGGQPAGTVVGTFSTTDPDAGNTFKYLVVPDPALDGTGQFEIVGNQLRTKASFNAAVKSSYTIRVRSTDQGGLFTSRLFTILVTG